MKLVAMRFKGVQWHHNPREISFECDKIVNERNSPFGNSYIQNTGRRNMKIIGKGELYGEDCLEQFERLFALFKQGGSGVLALPHITPFAAVFEKLKITGKPKPDLLSYEFVFREVMEEKQQSKMIEYAPNEGENLWDVACKFHIAVEELLKLNPQIKRPDVIDSGEVIRLC